VHPVLDPRFVNVAPIDRLSIIHTAIGVFYGLLRVPWYLTLGAAVTWEIVERQLKTHNPEVFAWPQQESFANSLMDVTVTMAGWSAVELTRQWRTKYVRNRTAAAAVDGPSTKRWRRRTGADDAPRLHA